MAELTSSARASRCEWTLAALLAANFAWTTVCLGGYRPETALVTTTLTGAALLLWLGGRIFAPGDTTLPALHPAGWWLLPFLAYAAGNVLWVTPVPWLGWGDWIGWARLAAVFWLALNGLPSPGPRRLVWFAVAATGVAGVVLAAYQRWWDPLWIMLVPAQAPQFLGRSSGPFGIPNSFAAMMLLLIPPALALAAGRGSPPRIRWLAGGLAAVFLGGLVLTISRGPWLALALALAAWPLLVPGRPWRRRLGGAAVLALAVLAAGLVLYATLPGVRARFDRLRADHGERSRPIMWRAAWGLFRSAPVAGTGAGSYNILFERHRPEQFADETQWAHNDYLNTLSDYGVAGFALSFGAAAAVALLTVRAARRAPRPAPPGWAAPAVTRALAVALLAFALSLLADFHLKLPALALLVALVAGEAVRRAWPAPPSVRPTPARRGRTVLAALAILGLLTGLVLPHDRAEALRYGVRRELDRLVVSPGDPAGLRTLLAGAPAILERATALDPGNGQAWSDLAYVCELQVRFRVAAADTLATRAADAARHALALSSEVPEFWVRQGVALDLLGRWGEAGSSFAHAITLAPNNSSMWYFDAYHLNLVPAGYALAGLALENSLRLDPGNQLAKDLQQQIAARQPD